MSMAVQYVWAALVLPHLRKRRNPWPLVRGVVNVRLGQVDPVEIERLAARVGFKLRRVDLVRFSTGTVDYLMVFEHEKAV